MEYYSNQTPLEALIEFLEDENAFARIPDSKKTITDITYLKENSLVEVTIVSEECSSLSVSKEVFTEEEFLEKFDIDRLTLHIRTIRNRGTIKSYREITYEVVQEDDACCNPRDNDNIGTMDCYHRNYDFPNESKMSSEELCEYLKREDVISIPIYMYEHSGIAISTKPFGCQWDSGQLGWIHTTKENALRECPSIEVAKKIMESEVKTWGCYVEGEVYQYRIFKNGVTL